MKILCLHGFRTSGKFLQKQLTKWDPFIFHSFDLDFLDGMFPAGGKSDIDGIFPPPYFEWFQFNEDFTDYTNSEECVSFACDYISKNGPLVGFLGFSQGKVLKDYPPIKFFVTISGSKFRAPSICEVAYKDPMKVKSIHFIVAKDWLRLPSEELASSAFDSSIIIRHPRGHTVPRLDNEAVEKLQAWPGRLTQERCFVDKENANSERTDTNDEKHIKASEVNVEAYRESSANKLYEVQD